MKEDDLRSRLLEETRRVLDHHAALQAAVDGLAEKPPEPGDVFVLDRTSDFDVEWAIIARDLADEQRLFIVPADGCSLVGSTDVEISEVAPFGPLVLRCRFGRWLDARHFDPGFRVGFLDPDDVARARHKCTEVEEAGGTAAGGTAAGATAASVPHEIDDDPEYLDWVEDVLLPAQLALAGSRT